MAQTNEQSTARRSRKAMTLYTEACKADDVSLMEQAISAASESNSRFTVKEVVQRSLGRSAAMRAVHVLNYLVEHLHGADVAAISVSQIMANEDMDKPSQEVLEILVAHGWDINTYNDGWPLLWSVVRYPDLVRWCLDHGAEVDVPEKPPQVRGNLQRRTGVPRLTILGWAASVGSIETFELLGENGAPLDPQTLHSAVEHVTYSAPKRGCEPSSHYRERMDMVRFLVDVVKLDVNAIEHKLGRGCSTPLCIATGRPTYQDFRELVSFLLDRGADPYLNCKTREDAPGWPTAIACAQSWNNTAFLQAVKDSQAEKQVEKQGEQGGDTD